MAKQIAIHAVHQNQPVPAAAAVRRTFGLLLHDADGRIQSPTRTFATGDLFWGYEAVGAIVYSCGPDQAFFTPNGRVTGRRYVQGRGWCDSTKSVTASLGNIFLLPPRHRFRAFFTNLFACHKRIEWVEVPDSHYAFLTLTASGGVAVNGKPIQVGDSPIAVGQSWFIARPGDGQVQLADIDGVFDRYRYVSGNWQRLVQRRLASWSELEPGIVCLPAGEIIFTGDRVPPLIIPAGAAITIQLSGGRSLVRRTNCTSIYLLQTGDNHVEEFVCEAWKLWQQEGARDMWAFELLGVPGYDGEKPVLSKEVTPGVVVYQNGKVEALHRTFLGGEPIDLRFGGVSIRRAAGGYEPFYISAGGVIAGSLYAPSGDWFKMSPVSPDQKSFSWQRCLGQQDFVTTWVAHSDRVIGEITLLRFAGRLTAALWRLVKAADSEPFFAPFSIIIVVLYVVVQIARAALLMFALPVNFAARIFRQIQRAFQLTR